MLNGKDQSNLGDREFLDDEELVGEEEELASRPSPLVGQAQADQLAAVQGGKPGGPRRSRRNRKRAQRGQMPADDQRAEDVDAEVDAETDIDVLSEPEQIDVLSDGGAQNIDVLSGQNGAQNIDVLSANTPGSMPTQQAFMETGQSLASGAQRFGRNLLDLFVGDHESPEATTGGVGGMPTVGGVATLGQDLWGSLKSAGASAIDVLSSGAGGMPTMSGARGIGQDLGNAGRNLGQNSIDVLSSGAGGLPTGADIGGAGRDLAKGLANGPQNAIDVLSSGAGGLPTAKGAAGAARDLSRAAQNFGQNSIDVLSSGVGGLPTAGEVGSTISDVATTMGNEIQGIPGMSENLAATQGAVAGAQSASAEQLEGRRVGGGVSPGAAEAVTGGIGAGIGNAVTDTVKVTGLGDGLAQGAEELGAGLAGAGATALTAGATLAAGAGAGGVAAGLGAAGATLAKGAAALKGKEGATGEAAEGEGKGEGKGEGAGEGEAGAGEGGEAGAGGPGGGEGGEGGPGGGEGGDGEGQAAEGEAQAEGEAGAEGELGGGEGGPGGPGGGGGGGGAGGDGVGIDAGLGALGAGAMGAAGAMAAGAAMAGGGARPGLSTTGRSVATPGRVARRAAAPVQRNATGLSSVAGGGSPIPASGTEDMAAQAGHDSPGMADGTPVEANFEGRFDPPADLQNFEGNAPVVESEPTRPQATPQGDAQQILSANEGALRAPENNHTAAVASSLRGPSSDTAIVGGTTGLDVAGGQAARDGMTPVSGRIDAHGNASTPSNGTVGDSNPTVGEVGESRNSAVGSAEPAAVSTTPEGDMSSLRAEQTQVRDGGGGQGRGTASMPSFNNPRIRSRRYPGGSERLPSVRSYRPTSPSVSGDQSAARRTLESEARAQERLQSDAQSQMQSEVAPLAREGRTRLDGEVRPGQTAARQAATAGSTAATTAATAGGQAAQGEMTSHISAADAEAQAILAEQQAAPLPANIVGGDPGTINAEIGADQQNMLTTMMPDGPTEFQTPAAAQGMLATGPGEVMALSQAQDPGLERFENLERALELPQTDFNPDQASFDQVVDPAARQLPAELTTMDVDLSAPGDLTFERTGEDPIAGTAAMNEVQAQVVEQFEAETPNIQNDWESDLTARTEGLHNERLSEIESRYQTVQDGAAAEMQEFRTSRPAVEPSAQMAVAQQGVETARAEANTAATGLETGFSAAEAQFHTDLATEDGTYQSTLAEHGAAYSTDVEGFQTGYGERYTQARTDFETEQSAALGDLHGGQASARMTAEAQFQAENTAYTAGIDAHRTQFETQRGELDASFEQQRTEATSTLDAEVARVRGEADSEIAQRASGTRREVQRLQQQGQREVDQHLDRGRTEFDREIDRGVNQAERERRRAEGEADRKRNEDRGVLERIGDAIASVVDWVADCFAAARDAICNFLERAKNAALAKLRQWRQRALSALRRVRDGIQGAISGAANWIRGKIRAAGQAIRGVIDRASSLMQGAVQWFTDGVNGLVEGFQQGVNALADGFTTAVGFINEDLGNRLTEVKDEYMGRFNTAVDGAQESVSAAGEELQTNIQNRADSLNQQVQQAEDEMVQRVDTLEQNLHESTDQLYDQAVVATNAAFDRAEQITEAAFDAASEATRQWFDQRIAGLRASAQWVRETAAWAQDRLDEFVEWCGEVWDAFCEVLADCWTAVRSAFVAFWNSPWRDVLFAVALTVLAVVVTVATAGAGAPLLVAALAAGAAAGTAAAATYGAGEFAARRANVSLIQEGEQTWNGRSMPMTGPDGQPMLDENGNPRMQPDPTDPANDWYVDTLGSIRRDNDGMLTYVDENGETQRVDPSQPGARELLAQQGMARDEDGNLTGESLGESGRGAATIAAQKGAEHFVSGFAVGLTAGTGGGVLANMGTTGRIFTQGAISYASSTAVDPMSSVIEQQMNTDRSISESAGEWWETRSHERQANYAVDEEGNEIVDENGNRQLVGYGRGREMSAGEIVTQEAVAFAGNVATAGLAQGGNVWLQNRGVPMNIMDRSLRQSLTARGVDLTTGVAGEAVSLGANMLTGREQGVNSWEDFQQRLLMAGVSSTASSIASDHAQIRGREMAVNHRLRSDPDAQAAFNNLSRRDRSHVAEILDGGVGPMRPEGGGGTQDTRSQRMRNLLNDPETLRAYNAMPEQQRLAYSRSLEAAEHNPEFQQAMRGRTPEEQAALGDLVGQRGDSESLRGILGDPEALDTYLSLSPAMRQQYAQRMIDAEGAETRSNLGRAFQDEDLVQRFMRDPESVPADQRPRAEQLLRQRQELEAQTRMGNSSTDAEEGNAQHRAAGNSEDVSRRANQARRNMTPEDQTAFDAMIEAAPSGAHRAMIERAAAAGNDVDTIRQMASHMRGMSDAEVLANFTGQGVFQDFLESCVPTSYQIARAERDPMYAYRLQTDPVFRAQEQQTALQQMGGRTVGRGAPGDDAFDNPRIRQALEDNPELAAFYRDQNNFSDEGTAGVETPLVRDTDVHRNLESATGREYEVHTREGMNWRHGTGDGQFADGAPPYHRIDAALDAGLPVPFSAHGHESVIIGSFMRDGQRHYIIHDPMSGGTSAVPRSLMDQIVYLKPSSVSLPRLSVRERASLQYVRGALGERMRNLFGRSRGNNNEGGTGTTRRPRQGDQTDGETSTGGRNRPRVRHGEEEIELSNKGVWTRPDGSPASQDDVLAILGRYTRVGDGRWRRPDGTFASEHEIIQLNRRRGRTEIEESNNQSSRRTQVEEDGADSPQRTRSSDEVADEIVQTYGRNMGESELRQAYMAEVRQLEGQRQQMMDSGMPVEQVARTLWQARRDIGQRYKDATPEALRHFIYEINQGRYGDPLGPKFDYLVGRNNGDYDKIARSSATPNESVDGLLAQFGVWLRQQPADYLTAQQESLSNPRRQPTHGPDDDPTLAGGGPKRPTIEEIAEGQDGQNNRRRTQSEGEEEEVDATTVRPRAEVETEEGATGNPQRMGIDEFMDSRPAQQRLLRQAQEALDEIGGRIRGMELGEGTELLMGLKRSNLDEFVASVQEKVARKGYTEVGQMGDMIRGRISVDDGATVDSIVAQLRREFPEAQFDIKSDSPYPRVHVDLEGANGIKFELQVGTKATNDFLETRGVRIPEVLQTKVGLETADFHVAKYDLLDKITGPRRAQYGLDELDADYNNILRSTGTGRLDPEQQAEITARVQRVLDTLAREDPEYLLSLYTKGSHGEVTPKTEVDGADNTQAGGGRRPTIEEIAAQAEAEQATPMLNMREYGDLLARQEQGEIIDLQTVPRPGIGGVNEDGVVVIGQGAGRWEKTSGTGRIDILIPADQPLPPGARLIESNIPGEMARAANLLSSRGAEGSNPVVVDIMTRGKTFKRISVAHDQTMAPTSGVAHELGVRTQNLRSVLGDGPAARILEGPDFRRLSPNEKLSYLEEVIAQGNRNPADETLTGGPKRPTIEEIAAENDGTNPLNRPLAGLLDDRPAQTRLFEMAEQAVNELGARIHGVDLPEGAVVLTGRKRNDVDSFVASVKEKVERKGYQTIGDMGDMIRGRISLDSGDDVRVVLDKLRQEFPNGVFDVKEDIPYPRIHADLEASNGMKFELQIGTKATNDFLETPGVRIPDVLRGKVGLDMADFHVAKYDLLDKITGPRRTELGLDDIDADYNAILKHTGTGELDPQRQAEITARVQKVLDQLAAEDPDYLLSLYTKGSHAPAETEADGANNTQAGGTKKPIEDIVRDAENQQGGNPLKRTLPELMDDPQAQARLMQMAEEALAEISGKFGSMEVPETAQILASKKREDLDSFIASVQEKVTRKEYGVVGEMGDMVRGRISVDNDAEMEAVLGELRRTFPDAEFDLKEDKAYPRIHVDIYASNGVKFELQLGTKASNDFFETRGIRIPTILQDKVGAEVHDLHIAKYDLLDKVDGPWKRELGLDELSARHDEMSIKTGRGELDPAEQQRLYDDYSRVLQRLADEDPDYLRSLFTKGEEKTEGADNTQAGGTKKPIDEIVEENSPQGGSEKTNPLKRNLTELLDDPGAQARLFQLAQEALDTTVARINGLDLPEGTKVAAMLKRDTPDEFIASVKEKVERKGYAEIGAMGDMVRGRISVDNGQQMQDMLAQLRTAFPDAVFDLKENTPYPRIHIDVKAENGVLFELQLGTKATNRFFEDKGIRIPDGLRDKVGPEFVNLHTAKYDLLDKVQGRWRTELGLDELSARHDEISVATGRGDLDPKAQQALYDDISTALQKIVDADPDYINSLYTKDKKKDPAAEGESTQAGARLNQESDADAESSGASGMRIETDEERIAREASELRQQHGSDDTNVAARLMAAAAAKGIKLRTKPPTKNSIKLTFGTDGEGSEIDDLFLEGGEELEVFLRTEGPWEPVSDGQNIVGIRCASADCMLIGEQVLNPKYAEYMEPDAAARFLRGLAKLNRSANSQQAAGM